MSRAREQQLIHQLQREWPAPDPAAVAISAELCERIDQEIEAAGGSLRFERYMEMALYEPGLGYYSAGLPRFGPGGDFTTAPLTSALFSRTLALQCAECLAQTGGVILELGAGTGRMAADMLLELAARDAVPERYYILEVSAALRQEQRQTLERTVPQWLGRVEWLDRLPETPLRGVIVANEVLDALPVALFRRSKEGVEELRVARARDGYAWHYAPAGAALAASVAALEDALNERLPAGYVSELCPRLPAWIASLSDLLEHGVLLFIDYGYPRREYYHPQRTMGTLMCHYRHRAHANPLILPGLQDITAFVDFTAVADAGLDAGLEVLGFAPQAQFLLGAGLPSLLEAEMLHADTRERLSLSQQAKQLMLPGEMGERFKVMALGRGYGEPLSGFGFGDQRGRL